MTRTAVIGLGVMGGSFARALRRLDPAAALVGWDRDPAQLAAAAAAAAITPATGVADAVAGADLVLVATPLGVLPEVLQAVAPALTVDALVMDVASLQGPALDGARAAGLGARYVSAHPLTGSESSGFAAARADLYDGAPVTLSVAGTPASQAAASLLTRAERLWTALGARPAVESPEEHDTRMALASHLPQLVANALARVLHARGVEQGVLGPGGRDMTRLAASSPAMWRDLLPHTADRVGGALRALSREAERLAAALERNDMGAVEEIMNETRAWRSR